MYLGSPLSHTVYEAEITDMILSAHLLLQEKNLSTVRFVTDNQAALKAAFRAKPRTGDHLAKLLKQMLLQLRSKNKRMHLELTWVPGHEGIQGNELTDEAINKVATRIELSLSEECPRYLRTSLPASATALKRTYIEELKKRALAH